MLLFSFCLFLAYDFINFFSARFCGFQLSFRIYFFIFFHFQKLIFCVKLLNVNSFSETWNSFMRFFCSTTFMMNSQSFRQKSPAVKLALLHNFGLKRFRCLHVMRLYVLSRHLPSFPFFRNLHLLRRFREWSPIFFRQQRLLVFSLFGALFLVNRKRFCSEFATTDVAN